MPDYDLPAFRGEYDPGFSADHVSPTQQRKRRGDPRAGGQSGRFGLRQQALDTGGTDRHWQAQVMATVRQANLCSFHIGVTELGQRGLDRACLTGTRLRLVRLSATPVRNFLPLPAAPSFLAGQESPSFAV